ncbi:MAG: ester cyclase [Flavobacteriales bacterium]|nr:ester cyclase [Flavobacteriales bacterium]
MFAGIPATGKQLTMAGNTIAHLRDGKIVSEMDCMDNSGLPAQLGVMPPMEPRERTATGTFPD